jgi:hypothetical protein
MGLNELLLSLGVTALLAWAAVRLLGPFAVALADRLRRRDGVPLDDGALETLRSELEALQERLDFVERTLTTRSSSADALPDAAREQPPSRATTPV